MNGDLNRGRGNRQRRVNEEHTTAQGLVGLYQRNPLLGGRQEVKRREEKKSILKQLTHASVWGVLALEITEARESFR